MTFRVLHNGTIAPHPLPVAFELTWDPGMGAWVPAYLSSVIDVSIIGPAIGCLLF